MVNKILTASEQEQIKSAIHGAETSTGAEILPIVVQRSSPIGHQPLLLSLILLLLLVQLDNTLVLPWSLQSSRPWYFLAYAVGAAIIAHIMARSTWVQRVLTPNADEMRQVAERASLEFYLARQRYPSENPIVVIFISLMEHRSVILADPVLNEKITGVTWQGVVDIMTPDISTGRIAAAIIKGIEHSAQAIPVELRRPPATTNQIPDHVIVRM